MFMGTGTKLNKTKNDFVSKTHSDMKINMCDAIQ